jgi:peroxiredoxin
MYRHERQKRIDDPQHAVSSGSKDMTIKIGDRLPEAAFKTMKDGKPAEIKVSELTKGRKVALFAVPGAFTPTCSARHLPGYKEKAEELRAKGVDAIACVSVNDVFVMNAWGKDQQVGEDIIMLADGNGEFAKAVGLEMDGSGFGMGKRSKRYSMVVDDGVVTQLNVEDGGEFRVSAADYMLGQL